MQFKNLAHHVDLDMLKEAFRLTRKDGAVGLDGVSAKGYEENLEANLLDLWERMKNKRYRAPNLRRAHIPKGKKGETRPIGIPTFEDKVAQRAFSLVLEAVYEQDFLDCSYGFRRGKSQHQALSALQNQLWRMKGGWLLEVDIKGFFNNLDHKHLREILSQRVCDAGIIRMVGKWLNAGIQEEGVVSYPEKGTPQGGVISPLLANIYLHTVLDVWFEETVKPRLKGEAFLVRWADDFIICFSLEEEARKVLEVIPKRFGRFGLEINEEKTRLVEFRRPPYRQKPKEKPETFDFLGFTHYWGMSRNKKWVVKKKTMKSRLARALCSINKWCKENRHLKLREQRKKLSQKLYGHYGYYGVSGNFSSIKRFYRQACRYWRKWLNRRSRKSMVTWRKMRQILKHYPLPSPKIVHKKAW